MLGLDSYDQLSSHYSARNKRISEFLTFPWSNFHKLHQLWPFVSVALADTCARKVSGSIAKGGGDDDLWPHSPLFRLRISQREVDKFKSSITLSASTINANTAGFIPY